MYKVIHQTSKMRLGNRHKSFSIQNFVFTIACFAAASAASKGLNSFKASIARSSDGTNDDVYLKLYKGVNGQTCKTGKLWEGFGYDSWSAGDVEEYKSSNQDFGDCGTFEADRHSIAFTIVKDGDDGLSLVKMEFHIGGETYVWIGQAEWDPKQMTQGILTATCSKGNCLPIDCTSSEWTNCKDCSADCTCKSTRTIIQVEKFGGKCPEREDLEKIIDCRNNNTCPSISDYDPNKENSTGSGSGGSGAGGAIAAVTMILLIVAVVFLLYRKWRAKQEDNGYVDDFQITFKDEEPLNLAVKKDANIRKNIKELADNKAGLKEEFKRIEKYTEEVIKVNNTVEVANKLENKEHNRYIDQVPYDLNMVKLQTPVGDPPGTYINASTITFSNMQQTFIAVQAPKENSYPAFWQLVLENQVTTIVMITGLVEGGKEKANQYWPDMNNPNMELGDINISYESHSYPGTYYHRKLVVRDGQGRERAVNHIQTTAWLDMKAPKDTKVLLDLVYKAQELAEERRGPMVVHCSAVVGRTGTLIGLYKLVNDYHNDRVKELDIYTTVVEMRSQRMKMVQKAAQYVYIAKCLQDYITASPMVVHCSAGVGRTGTLIGLYKLVNDYHNDRVKELDIYTTVVEMRSQRMKMVQKAAQYVYIAKCLQDYITASTDEYYG